MQNNTRAALQRIKDMDSVMITPALAATVIWCDPAYIRHQARTNPEALGFLTIVYKSRVKIPRKPFIAYVDTNSGGEQYAE